MKALVSILIRALLFNCYYYEIKGVINMSYRVFLGYREGSEGFEFIKKLRQEMNDENKYGKVYLSTFDEPFSNFLEFEFLDNIEYFVIPYTSGFFESRNDNKGKIPVIFKEIEYAILHGCKNFIAVYFDEDLSGNLTELYRKWLSDTAMENISAVVGAKHNFYDKNNEDELIREICEFLYIKKSVKEFVDSKFSNVFMSTKEDIQRFPLFQRLYGVKKLTFLNFAGTSFISGINVADIYGVDMMTQWFQKNVINGNIEIEVILTNPKSFADTDASKYKMKPSGRLNSNLRKNYTLKDEIFSDEELYNFIIRENFNMICDFKLRHNKNNIKVYYTDVVLPYGIMKSEFDYDLSDSDNMLINLYAPLIYDDKRPTFILLKENQETKNIYDIFNDSLNNILLKHAKKFSGHPEIDFLFRKPIIHRAKLNNDAEPLSREAIKNCAEKGYPIEVDLICTKEKVLVWRNEQNEDAFPEEKYHLLDYSEFKVNKILRDNIKDNDSFSQIMTLQEMLDMVIEISEKQETEPIPLLIEIKENWEPEISDKSKDNIIKICRIMEKYRGNYALHSANPNVVRTVKNYDVRIPCGQITLDFNNSKYNDIAKEYIDLHNNAEYYDIVVPDFISCKIGDFFENSIYNQMIAKYGLKQIGWSATSFDEYEEAYSKCDNVMIEFEPEMYL